MEAKGTYVQRGFLPGWLASTLGLLFALTIAFVTIWLAYQPKVQTAAAEKPQNAADITEPGASPEPDDELSDPPKEPNKPAPKDPKDPEGSGGGGGGGGGGGKQDEPEKEKKPAKQTAATAVGKVAALSEGRHICYRVFVADGGWQDPVCDGSTAGKVGEDKPVKALNIAVSGTKGAVGAAAYVVGGWREKDRWHNAPDRKDLYLGSTKKADPPLEGFAIKTVDGVVCQNTNVRSKGWMGRGCTKPGDWIYAGSPMKEKHPLRAVWFKV